MNIKTYHAIPMVIYVPKATPDEDPIHHYDAIRDAICAEIEDCHPFFAEDFNDGEVTIDADEDFQFSGLIKADCQP